MIVEIGTIALSFALLVAMYAGVASFVGAWQRLPTLIASARYGMFTIPFLLGIATSSLVYAFVTNDFSVKYVAENSNLAMPVSYTWVAFYAGNSGSLLFIAFVFSILAVVAVFGLSARLNAVVAHTTGLLAILLIFFIGVIVFLADPLERYSFVPLDGQGINPLLVHFGMFIHPPIQMLGLVSVAIPFGIAMGTLISGKGSEDEWVDFGRMWGMISWLLLTLGLFLGSWWAYTILGWGGYWAWDPVENSALMPWLIMTAFVHSIMVQKRRGMFRMWNIILITLAFTMAQMGMFINRGGPVPSVHSFAQSTMGWLFLFFMAFTLLGSLLAFAWRMDKLKSRGTLESIISREGIFLTQNVIFIVVALVTLWGTIYPVISQAFTGTIVTVGEPFFNRVNGPLLLVIVLLMGIGPLLPWRKTRIRTVASILRFPVMISISSAIVLAIIGVREPVVLAAIAIVMLSVVGILHEWVRGVISRHRSGEPYVLAFVRLLAANRPRYGGYVVHLAIAMLAIGAIGSSFYDAQRDFSMVPGQNETLGSYSFTYLGLESFSFEDREESIARFEVKSGSRDLGTMSATRTFYPNFNMSATRAAIRSTPIEDFYIVPSEFGDDDRTVFRVYVNPLVWWMWFAAPVLLLGTLLAIFPTPTLLSNRGIVRGTS